LRAEGLSATMPGDMKPSTKGGLRMLDPFNIGNGLGIVRALAPSTGFLLAD